MKVFLKFLKKGKKGLSFIVYRICVPGFLTKEGRVIAHNFILKSGGFALT